MRRLWVIAAGAAFGLFVGAIPLVVLITGRSELNNLERAFCMAVLALGALNGAFGAWDGWRSGLCRAWTVAWAPALPFLFPVVLWAQYPSNSKMWVGPLVMVGIVAPFVWVAGRMGQEFGVWGRPRQAEPVAAPDPAT